MVDVNLLKEKIQASGYKIQYIAETCGLSVMGLRNKIEGKTEFTVSELTILICLLKLSLEDVMAIFFVKNVPNSKQNSLL